MHIFVGHFHAVHGAQKSGWCQFELPKCLAHFLFGVFLLLTFVHMSRCLFHYMCSLLQETSPGTASHLALVWTQLHLGKGFKHDLTLSTSVMAWGYALLVCNVRSQAIRHWLQ